MVSKGVLTYLITEIALDIGGRKYYNSDGQPCHAKFQDIVDIPIEDEAHLREILGLEEPPPKKSLIERAEKSNSKTESTPPITNNEDNLCEPSCSNVSKSGNNKETVIKSAVITLDDIDLDDDEEEEDDTVDEVENPYFSDELHKLINYEYDRLKGQLRKHKSNTESYPKNDQVCNEISIKRKAITTFVDAKSKLLLDDLATLEEFRKFIEVKCHKINSDLYKKYVSTFDIKKKNLRIDLLRLTATEID